MAVVTVGAAVAVAVAVAADGNRAMNRGFSGGKRNREASRDLRKRQKEERLRYNRELRARGIDPDLAAMAEPAAPLPEVKLEDIVIGVPSQPRREDFGPVKVFVGGLSSETTSADLRTAFAKFGELVDAAVVGERATNQSRGLARDVRDLDRRRHRHQRHERRRARRPDHQGQPGRGPALSLVSR